MEKEPKNQIAQNFEKKKTLEQFNQERYGEEGLALKEKLSKLPDDFESLTSCNDAGIKLQEKYGKEKCLKVMAFHILVGSTPKIGFSESEGNKFDFDREDSVEKFIDKKLEEEEKELEK